MRSNALCDNHHAAGSTNVVYLGVTLPRNISVCMQCDARCRRQAATMNWNEYLLLWIQDHLTTRRCVESAFCFMQIRYMAISTENTMLAFEFIYRKFTSEVGCARRRAIRLSVDLISLTAAGLACVSWLISLQVKTASVVTSSKSTEFITCWSYQSCIHKDEVLRFALSYTPWNSVVSQSARLVVTVVHNNNRKSLIFLQRIFLNKMKQ